MKRLHVLPLLVFALLTMTARPTRAQSDNLASWVPADANAFLSLAVGNPDAALQGLNIGAFVGAYLQPTRPALEGVQPFDTFFPLDLLDLETASFTQLVLTWLADSIGVAYGGLELPAGGVSDEVLLILPSRDPFEAASVLAAAVEGQDLLQSETMPGAALYVGDQAAIAVTPAVVLIGSEAMVRTALAAQSGSAPSLADSDDFQAVSAALPENPDLLFFARGQASASALPALFSLTGEAGPLLADYGAALEARDGLLPASVLMQGDVEALGVALDLSASLTRKVSAEIALLAPSAVLPESAPFNPDVLAFVPRRAMLVLSAADAAILADAAVTALPFAASGPGLLSALPLQPPLPAGVVAVPDAQEALAVLDALQTTLAANGMDWDAVRGQMNGSGLLALLPRPNNPLPVTEALADVLLVVESTAPDALADAVNQLLAAYLVSVEETIADGAVRYAVTPEGANEPVLQFSAVAGFFLLGTGQTLDEALRASAGDNRLIDLPRWEVAGSPAPGLYLDMDRLYNTFLPVPGGSATRPVNRVGVTGTSAGDGLFELSAVATVTLGG